MCKVLVTDGMNKNAIDRLRKFNIDVEHKFYDGMELGEKLKDKDILVIRSKNVITKEIIDKACEGNTLKLIIRSGVGLDNIDVKYANEKGIKVLNTPNASTRSVAELTIGQIITLSRFINIANVTMRDGQWNKKQYVGTEIFGKTLGIIGLGRIGKTVANMAYNLGMNVIYYDILGKIDGYENYKFCTFEEVLKNADFITIHIPLERGQGYLIGTKEFNMMKDRVYFINHARGGLVCEKALIKALDSGKVEAAALDVYEKEPNVNLELVNHPMVSPTPHLGASTVEAQERIGREIVKIIYNFLLENEIIDNDMQIAQ
ncbi:MAG: D-2-hydroxyacid dehydrogenase [Terrisporobacter sp.]|uniref:D-2-hydroxyacid dehydrogenase n=1 Tax=Terrisporobacter sp. TaxID=1965305 RepID=UPI0025D29D14|nr:D-2-hydroxyacid dehydrogenase [uncultured Terrisporobacter sp.]